MRVFDTFNGFSQKKSSEISSNRSNFDPNIHIPYISVLDCHCCHHSTPIPMYCFVFFGLYAITMLSISVVFTSICLNTIFFSSSDCNCICWCFVCYSNELEIYLFHVHIFGGYLCWISVIALYFFPIHFVNFHVCVFASFTLSLSFSVYL